MPATQPRVPMQVPFFRAPACAAPVAERMAQACSEVLRSGVYVLGPRVRAVEHSLSALLEGREVVAVNSGSDALLLALAVLGVGTLGGGRADDEVMLPSYTFVACAEAVVAAGARPVFVDCADADFLPALDNYRQASTPRSRAILAVGLFGDASGLPPLAGYCRQRGLHLIEDIAQCLGAVPAAHAAPSHAAGTWGDAAAMSFYPTKTLGAAGDAGALAFRDARHARTARMLRNHGHDGSTHARLGRNSRMDELQAALLQVALQDFAAALARRRAIAGRYLAAWATGPLGLPRDTAGHAWNYFVVTLPSAAAREALAAGLAARGIATRVYYPAALHTHAALSPLHGGRPLPHSERLARCSLALPLYPALTDEEVGYIADAVRAALPG